MNAITLSNQHANALALNLVYSPADENMLVAVVLASTSSQMLEAIKAQMEKNGGNILTAFQDDEDSVYLTAAGRGYTHVKSLFSRANASGQARAHLHQLAGDPRLHPKENYFYVVVEHGTPTHVKLGERLQLATHHTILPEWYERLMRAGWDAGLVESLPILGDEHFFQAAYRVLKDDAAWGQIISEGLKSGELKIT